MENLSIQFVDKIYEMSNLPFPEQIVQKARECLIDYLSVVIGGCKSYRDINKRFVEENKLIGDSHIIGYQGTADLRTAVMINAFNAHVLELDDSHRVAMTHLGAPIFSALLGTAEVYGSTLDELLCAAVVGYEAAIRLANTIQPSHKKRGFHVSGTCCTVGCALGIASMLKYSKAEMMNVLSAAATTAAGLLGIISGESEQKPYNVANAAAAGVNAALYGKHFNGAVDILNDSRGFFRAVSDVFYVDKLFESGYAIDGIYQKLYAACRHCHAPMEAMLEIKAAENFRDDEIERIEIRTYDLAINGHDQTEIESVSAAKQSIPYGVAVACLYQNCGIDAFTNDKILDRRLSELVKKVNILEDSDLTALVPERRAAIVTVFLQDGTQISQRVDYPKGEPENPITKTELINKFYSLIRSAGMGEDTGAQILEFACNASNQPAAQLFQWL